MLASLMDLFTYNLKCDIFIFTFPLYKIMNLKIENSVFEYLIYFDAARVQKLHID